jgi:probable HAF family extracellular repeat protein
VGSFTDANGHRHGFLLSDGQYTTLDDPNAGVFGTSAEGINDRGQIVGVYNDVNGYRHGFVLSHGQYTTLDDPLAVPGYARGTAAVGINDRGQVVGAYDDSNGAFHGFLLSGGQYTTIDDPDGGSGSSQGTLLGAINDHGLIVGELYDANNNSHALLAVPTRCDSEMPVESQPFSQECGAPCDADLRTGAEPGSADSGHYGNQDDQAPSRAAGSAGQNTGGVTASPADHSVASKDSSASGSDPFAIDYDVLQ